MQKKNSFYIHNENIFLPALVVPTFTDLISMGQLAQNFKLTFTKDNVHPSQMGRPPTHAKILGRRTARYIYVAGGGCEADVAAPSTQNKERKKKRGATSGSTQVRQGQRH